MAWTIPIALNDVVEVTVSYAALEQLIQYKFDVLIGGAGGPVDSEDLNTALMDAWVLELPLLMANSCAHLQTRYQKILDCVLGTNGPKRVRGVLAKTGHYAGSDGAELTPHLPVDTTVSVALITDGPPRAMWGKKGFSQLPESATAGNGEALESTVHTAWDTACTNFFTATLPIAGALTFNCGLLPTTFVANQALPHAGMFTYFKPFIGVEVGTYVGSQRTRSINPQSLRSH